MLGNYINNHGNFLWLYDPCEKVLPQRVREGLLLTFSTGCWTFYYKGCCFSVTFPEGLYCFEWKYIIC